MRVGSRFLFVRPGRLIALSIVSVVSVLGAISLLLSASALQPPGSEQKDIRQEWVLARSLVARSEPYGLIDERPAGHESLKFGPGIPLPLLHPLTDGLVFAAASLVSYQVFVILWFWFEVVCLFASAHLLSRVVQPHAPFPASVVVGLGLVCWSAVATELRLGQLMLVILLLLLLAREALRTNRPVFAGLLIGATLLLKPVLWPIVVLFALRRTPRVALSSAALVGCCYLAVAALMGVRAIEFYFRVVGPSMSKVEGSWVLNISTRAVGRKVFGGTVGVGVQNWIVAPPIVASAPLAGVTAIAVPVVVLVAAMVTASRLPDVDDALAVLVCASILVSPLAWEIDFVLAAFPVAHLIRRLRDRGYPVRSFSTAVLLVTLLLPSSFEWMAISAALSGQRFSPAASLEVPPSLALLTMVPTIALLGLSFLIVTLGRSGSREAIVSVSRCAEINQGSISSG